MMTSSYFPEKPSKVIGLYGKIGVTATSIIFQIFYRKKLIEPANGRNAHKYRKN